MATRSWFKFNGAVHALKGTSRGLCGVQPLKMPEAVELADGEVPDGYCRPCLLKVGESWVEEESMEDAKARGYYPVDPLEDDLQDSKQGVEQA